MVLTRKLGKVMVAVIMALSFASIGLSSAFAEDGDFTVGSSNLLTSGNDQLSAQEDGDYTVDSWASLQDAINYVGDGKKITLNTDIVAGSGDGALAVVRPDVSFTIDLAGHTINRNLQSMGETNTGHVLDVNQGTLTITDSSSDKTGKITGGFDENGGGIIVGGEGHLVIASGSITGNQAYNGGGIFVYGTLEMSGGSVSGNTGGDCGGIYNYGGAITLSNVTVSNNIANGAGGAGINNKGTATVSSCTISGNTANLGGGGIYNDNNLTLTNCTISGNTSYENGGGLNTHGTATLEGCTFENNSATADGGALYSYGGTTTLTTCALNTNKAEASGGAIRAWGGTVELKSTALNANQATWYGGGIFCNNDGILKILNGSTIKENIGYKGGGGVFVAAEMREVHVGSGVKVVDNKANNIYLTGDRRLTVDNELVGDTKIGVALENLGGTFTMGFSSTNPNTDPNSVFDAEAGYSVLRDGDGEARVVTSDWIELQALIDNAAETGEIIKLDRSWQAADENTALIIPADKTITINLNGHTIDRHRTTYADNGEVFIVNGTLNLTDNASDKMGAIRGGYGKAGGIRINNGALLKLHGGAIMQNRATEGGGGVRVEEGGTLETYGGAILSNTCDTDGGGVYNCGTFTNEECDITYNTAEGSGGGIYNAGTATLNSGSIASNRASGAGGGIFLADGTMSVKKGGTPVSIDSNSCKGNGGGLQVAGGTATFEDGEIKGNSAAQNGGGACIPSGGTLTFQDVIVTGNFASYDGGGVYVDCRSNQGAFIVSGCPQVTGNTASIGRNILLANDNFVTIGGALSATESNKAHLDVITQDPLKALTYGYTDNKCDITCFTMNDTDQSQLEEHEGELYIKQASGDRTASSWGQLEDAIRDQSCTTVVLTGDVVAGEDDEHILLGGGKSQTIDLNGYTINRNLRHPEGSDGCVFEVDGNATLTIVDSVGTGVITGGYADEGGGIYINEGSTVNLLGGTITGNQATSDGGGIYALGQLNSTGGAIVRNTADDNGGGIYAEDDGNLNLTKTIVANNTSHNEGGGIDIRVDRDNATLTQCQIRNNNTEDDYGGGIYLNESGLLLTLQDCVVDGNSCNHGDRGGGIYVEDGRLTVIGGSISNNHSRDGGGIYNNECAIVLNGTTISGNTTLEHGGAGISNHGSAQLSNCTIIHNIADGEGGGIYSAGDDSITAENCTFQDNESKNESGGGICTKHATTLTNCTFKGNKAHTNGGGICVNADYFFDVDDSIVYQGEVIIDGGEISGNEATEYGGGISTDAYSQLSLLGKTSELKITQNLASLSGGGVYIADNNHFTKVGGKVTVTGNDADNDLFLADTECIDVVDSIDGSQILVVLERGTGVFTSGLKDHATGDPAQFFLAQAGQWVIPTGDGEAQVSASDWPLLQKMIDDAADGEEIKLKRDWKAAPENMALHVPAGKGITIDLNGHTIDRARTEFSSGGEVFVVEGALTVKDTSEGANGKITGGYGDGGGIAVSSGATLNLTGGNVSGNRAKNGGGVLVYPGGTLNMTGGTIGQNIAEVDGGGVCAADAGDGLSSTVDMTGGQIVANEAYGSAGGMRAGAGSDFSIGGVPKISDNIAPQGPNLLLAGNVVMNVTAKLDGNARIDIIAQSPTRALTSNLDGSQSADVARTVFTYDKKQDRLEVRDSELYLIQSQDDVVSVSEWVALQNAINDGANQGKVIRLANDIAAGDDEDRLLLEGKNAIVDLNGHTLDRRLNDDDDDGHVFELTGNSTLTIRDTAGSGRVTGGFAEHGGAINIHEGSTCNVEGGTFMGNRASEEGGAFFVYGTLNMTGGMIAQNSTESGGGIFVHENGTINLENVVLVNNKAEKWGGGAINNKGNATLVNCTIKNNWADNEGGGIYNGDKSLVVNGCTIAQNSSSGGGGLCCYGTVTISNTTISNNYGDDYGGGLFTRGVVTIEHSTITGNIGKTDGGGIYNLGGLLTVIDTGFSSNSTEAGGGALNNKGTATLTTCTMTNNRANLEGGCIYEGVDGSSTIDGCSLQGNTSGKDGGAVAACGIMTIANSTIKENSTDLGGAGVYSYGDTTITNTIIKNNTSKESGGALLARNRALTLENTTITQNSTNNLGAGLMVEGGSGDVTVKGAVVIKDNVGSGDVFLSDGKLLTVGSALAGDNGAANIWVRTQNGLGVVFTRGYSDANPGIDPATYFFSNDGYLVYLEGSEASTKKFTPSDNSFIDPNSQVNHNNGQLTGVNWMSGISGERRLNEIDMPGTHDSATAAVAGNLSTGEILGYVAIADTALDFGNDVIAVVGSFFGANFDTLATKVTEVFAKFAKCQTRYIDEQLEDGIRSFDLRLNTYCVKPGWPPQPKVDNGEDLYLCHGKTDKGGTFFAYDGRTSEVENPDFITFKEVLAWMKSFLENHPTETVIINVAVESVDDVEDVAMARIKKHLHDELATQINPSTGEPYLYMEDGVFGKKYSAYPQLKDCRGQIVLQCDNNAAEILGGLVAGVGLSSVEKPDGSYEDNAEQKIANLKRFFADHGYNDLPTTAGGAIDYLYSVGTNGTDSRSVPLITPLEIANDVLDAMFGENGLIIDKAGKYIGLINMDGENAAVSKVVWSSNFFNALEYCKVTVKSGYSDEVTDVTYVVCGTPITIPDCIYNNPNEEGKYFQAWKGESDASYLGKTWTSYPGEPFIITGDTTFTALWGEQNTRVSVVWRDGDNEDQLRPDEKLTIKVKGSEQPYEILKRQNWKTAIPGSVAAGDITVDWDRIGEDAEGTYACEVRKREVGTDIVIELTHTPNKDVNAKGTVNWVDNNDAAGKRPQNVTVHLLADGTIIDSTTATAENNWAWDLGVRPGFVDGQKITYSIEEEPVESYTSYEKGFDITNVLSGVKQSTVLTGMIFWADDNNAGRTRPKSVIINLLKDGEKVDSKEVSKDEHGYWLIEFEIPGSYADGAYSITEDPVEGYTSKIMPLEQTAGMILVSNVLANHAHTPETASRDMVAPTCTQVGMRRTVEYCSECGEIFSDKMEDIPATGHDWGEWQTIKGATQTRMGLQARVCKNNVSHTQMRVIPKEGHKHHLVHVEAKPATCTEDGNIEYWECTGGDDSCELCFTDAAGTQWVHHEGTVVHATGHDWGEWKVMQEPTEVSLGIEKRVCGNDARHVQFRVIPETNHEHGLTHIEAKEATCTEDGNIEYWQCTEGDNPCGLCFGDAAATEQIQKQETVIPALGHDWGVWRLTKAPSESEMGGEVRVCHRNPLLHIETRVVPKVGHVHGLTKVEAKPATCTEDGNIEYWKCEGGDDPCGLLFKDPAGGEWVHEEGTVIHALGHEWAEPTYEWNADDTEVTATHVCLRDASHKESETVTAGSILYAPPTCTDPGKTLIISQRFSGEGFMPQAKQGPDVPALGHQWGEWTVVKPATETKEGLEEHVCARCGAKETRAIPTTVEYRYVGADGVEWTKGSSDALPFTFKRSLADETTYDHFKGIKIDGEAVPEKGPSGTANYTAKSGSVVVELQPAYLETLSVGDHEIQAVFDDGSATASFTVKAAPTKPTSSANTGDALPVIAVVVIALVAAISLVAIVIAKRKNKE